MFMLGKFSRQNHLWTNLTNLWSDEICFHTFVRNLEVLSPIHCSNICIKSTEIFHHNRKHEDMKTYFFLSFKRPVSSINVQ